MARRQAGRAHEQAKGRKEQMTAKQEVSAMDFLKGTASLARRPLQQAIGNRVWCTGLGKDDKTQHEQGNNIVRCHRKKRFWILAILL